MSSLSLSSVARCLTVLSRDPKIRLQIDSLDLIAWEKKMAQGSRGRAARLQYEEESGWLQIQLGKPISLYTPFM